MSLIPKYADSLLWCAHPVLQSVLAVIMYRRRLNRAYPIFFSYIVAQIAIFVLLFPLRGNSYYEAFFYCYWATTLVSVILGFRVIHEIFMHVFRTYHGLRDLGTVLFKWAGLVMLMVACVVAASSGGGSTDPIVNGILALQRSVRVVQVGLVLFLMVFSRYLGTSWKQKSFGIALGLGGFAAVELLLVALNGSVTSHENQALRSFINMAAYNLAILLWIGYVLAPQEESVAVPSRIEPRRWEQSLSELQHPGSADSLIPMFEGMVDRALSRGRSTEDPTALDDMLAKTDALLARQSSVPAATFEPVRTAVPQR